MLSSLLALLAPASAHAAITSTQAATQSGTIIDAWVTAMYDYTVTLFTNATVVSALVAIMVIYFVTGIVRRKFNF